jgi:hypothetical protein
MALIYAAFVVDAPDGFRPVRLRAAHPQQKAKWRNHMQKGLIPAIAGVLALGAATTMVVKRRAVKKAALAARSKVTEMVAPRAKRKRS